MTSQHLPPATWRGLYLKCKSEMVEIMKLTVATKMGLGLATMLALMTVRAVLSENLGLAHLFSGPFRK
jgi:hypothetical protein